MSAESRRVRRTQTLYPILIGLLLTASTLIPVVNR